MKYRFFHVPALDSAAETEVLNRFLAERPGALRALRLSARRRKRYRERRAVWEAAWREGHIDALTLQRGYDAVRAITFHADGRNWRRNELARHPAPEV